ncbi:MAG: hypothetical protein AAGI13_07050 [Pseudomonadota bacterium]
MRLPGFVSLLVALTPFAFATPAQAAWELRQIPGLAVIEQVVEGTRVTFQCLGRQKDRLQVGFDRGAEDMPATPAVMLWIEAPDGRTARHSMDAFKEGPGLSATLLTSDIVLDQLRQAAALEFTIAGTGKRIVRTNAKGTGAFRLAVLEQCGF